MSATLFPSDVLFSQRMLKAEGLYGGILDGIWGPLTERAADTFERESLALQRRYGGFDLRTERNINTLTLPAQREARQFMARIHAVFHDGPVVKIISGTRSYALQNKIFRQGRYHNPGSIITHARGGSSAHNFGIAWDIGVFSKTQGYITDGMTYREIGKAVPTDTLEWGGSWPAFIDLSHYQLKLAEPMAAIRKHFEAGESYFV